MEVLMAIVTLAPVAFKTKSIAMNF